MTPHGGTLPRWIGWSLCVVVAAALWAVAAYVGAWIGAGVNYAF